MAVPISSDQAEKDASDAFPDEVIECFNQLIVGNLRNGQAVILQKVAARLIAQRMHIPEHEVYQRGYLDVEDMFRAAGWSVEYDKPGYCETYEAFFKFKRKKQ